MSLMEALNHEDLLLTIFNYFLSKDVFSMFYVNKIFYKVASSNMLCKNLLKTYTNTLFVNNYRHTYILYHQLSLLKKSIPAFWYYDIGDIYQCIDLRLSSKLPYYHPLKDRHGNPINALSRYCPREIGALYNLKYLDLSNNNLTGIPKELQYLKNLEFLVLDDNHLITIRSEIGLLENLKHLSAKNNHLIMISPNLGKLKKLEVMDLSHNLLKSIPSEMTSNINIILDDNPILLYNVI